MQGVGGGWQGALGLGNPATPLPSAPCPHSQTDAIQDAFKYFAARGASAMVIPEFVPTPDNLAFTGAVARLDRAIYGLIAERRR